MLLEVNCASIQTCLLALVRLIGRRQCLLGLALTNTYFQFMRPADL